MTGTGSQRGCAPPPQHLVNLTPHDVVLDLGAGKQLRIPASGVVPRLVLSGGRLETLHVVDPSRPKDSPTATHAVPLVMGTVLHGVDPPLPDPRPGTVYITSRTLAEHFAERADLVWPDDLVRDAQGRVIAARRLASHWEAPHTTSSRVGGRPDESD
ncbi:hypothetical protein [Actinomyces viscosus]|uniref:hypothetical protein n=1 Tax=Actinomyces viscosus TaxID=1656 RepID=UPI0012EC02AB|nr:hypothetical protein [Actinomyces viscosus]